MRYIHSIIQTSQRILNCLPLDEEPKEHCDVIFIFLNQINVYRFPTQKPNIELLFSYPLISEIKYITIVGKRLGAITQDASLLLLDQTPPFTLRSKISFSNTSKPSENPLAYFASSPYLEYLVCCGFSKNVVVFEFDSNDEATKTEFLLPDIIVLGLIPTHSATIFIFFVSTNYNTKKLYLIDVKSQKLLKIYDIEFEYHTIVSVFDSDNNSIQVLFSDNNILINKYDPRNINNFEYKIEQNNEQKMISYYPTKSGELIIQYQDGSIYILNPNYQLYVKRGILPLISKFLLLENGYLICISESGDLFYFLISSIQNLSLNYFSFEDKSKIFEIPLSPIISDACLLDKNLFLCQGNDQYFSKFSCISNSLDFDIKRIEIKDFNLIKNILINNLNNSNYINNLIKLFSSSSGHIFLSSNQFSHSLVQEVNISKEQTLASFDLGPDTFQILSNYIINIYTNERWPIDKNSLNNYNIISFCYSDSYIALITSNYNVIIFNDKLQIIKEKIIFGAKLIEFCNESIAILTDDDKGSSSILSLYNSDLLPMECFSQISLKITQLLYHPDTNELFISSNNGLVYKYKVDIQMFSKSFTLVFQDSNQINLISLSKFIIRSEEHTSELQSHSN